MGPYEIEAPTTFAGTFLLNGWEKKCSQNLSSLSKARISDESSAFRHAAGSFATLGMHRSQVKTTGENNSGDMFKEGTARTARSVRSKALEALFSFSQRLLLVDSSQVPKK